VPSWQNRCKRGAEPYGPIPHLKNGDAWQAVVTGMVLVAAIQNAAHRIHLGNAPPSTLMTGTTT
jgi:uncharacterized membrane protein YoaK (UPF0700 family)